MNEPSLSRKHVTLNLHQEHAPGVLDYMLREPPSSDKNTQNLMINEPTDLKHGERRSDNQRVGQLC